MKTKYFRFLYGAQKSCMVHFGELTDTLTEERFTFLYIRRMGRGGSVPKSGKSLFLCPKQVDLVVLGSADEDADAALQEILQVTEVRLVVLPKSDYSWKTEFADAKQVVMLSPEAEQKCSADRAAEFAADNMPVRELVLREAGWKFFLKSYAAGSIVMAHSLDGNPDMACDANPEREADTICEKRYEDCIMSVKVLEEEAACCVEGSPDGYACALGCVQKRDSDVCRYQRKAATNSYLTGTLLCGSRMSRQECGQLEQDMGAWMEEMRFFCLPDCTAVAKETSGEESRGTDSCFGRLARKFKRYYLAGREELSAETVKEICDSGLYQVPGLFGDGDGICCSGLLKYREL